MKRRRKSRGLATSIAKGVTREFGKLGSGIVSGLLDLFLARPRRRKRRW